MGEEVARLADVRRRLSLSQTELAERIGVSQARVSAIEKGLLSASEIGTISKYVTALGGRLEVIVDLDGERLLLR
ncbi:helix-turn-helix domain-containing protein [Micromonospora echinospora]